MEGTRGLKKHLDRISFDSMNCKWRFKHPFPKTAAHQALWKGICVGFQSHHLYEPGPPTCRALTQASSFPPHNQRIGWGLKPVGTRTDVLVLFLSTTKSSVLLTDASVVGIRTKPMRVIVCGVFVQPLDVHDWSVKSQDIEYSYLMRESFVGPYRCGIPVSVVWTHTDICRFIPTPSLLTAKLQKKV
jgi:hypothetical protein